MRIATFDDCPSRAAHLRDGLSAMAEHEVHLLANEQALAPQLIALAPDVTFVSTSHPLRDVIEECFATDRLSGRPVALFVDPAEARWNRSALAAGLAAYAIEGLDAERLSFLLDQALSLFTAQQGAANG